MLQSNAFSTSPWNTNLVTATSGQSGYNGNNNAWKIDLTGAAGNLAVGGLSVGSVGTYSVYAKAGTLNWILLGSQTGNIQAYINLSDGSIGTTGALVIGAKTEDVGGGWYRCSMTYSGTATVARVYPAQANGNLTATSGNILIQNAQLESGMVSTDYLESTSVTGKAGVLIDLPRIDYSSGAGALLLEPSRQQLVQFSEYLGASDWVKLGAGAGSVPNITHNYATSPEGVQNATRVQLNLNGGTSSSDQSLFYEDLGAGTGDFIRSIYIKSNSGDVDLYFGGTLSDYETISVTNEWQRFDAKSSLSSQTRYFSLGLRGTTGSSDSADILIYGCQYESGSYPTSYIPNHGESGGVTRAADSCSVTGASDVIGQTEGTFFGEFVFKSAEPTNRLFSISGANWNTIGHIRFDMISLRPQAKIRTTGADVAEVIGTEDIAIGSLVKFAVVYTSTTLKAFVNGAQVGSTDTLTGSLPSLMDDVFVDALGGEFSSDTQNNQLNPYKQAVLFKEALTDAECITLTTL